MATVEAAKGKQNATLPPRLKFALWCEKYHALPGAGSLHEQEYREMYLNEVLPSIYEAVQNWRNHGGRDLAKGDQAVINWLAKIGAM